MLSLPSLFTKLCSHRSPHEQKVKVKGQGHQMGPRGRNIWPVVRFSGEQEHRHRKKRKKKQLLLVFVDVKSRNLLAVDLKLIIKTLQGSIYILKLHFYNKLTHFILSPP